MLYRPDGSNVNPCRRQTFEAVLRILMPGTLGAELIEDLKPNKDVRLDPEMLFNGEFQEIGSNELVYSRPRGGAFHTNGLEADMRAPQLTTPVKCCLRF